MKKLSSTPTLYTVNGLSEQTGVDRRTIKKRLAGTKPRKMDGVSAFYALEDLTEATAQTTDADSLKEQKLREEVRKLKLANDIKERVLVNGSEYEAAMETVIPQVISMLYQKVAVEGAMEMTADVPSDREKLNNKLEQAFERIRELGLKLK